MRSLVFLSELLLTACFARPHFKSPKARAADKYTTEELPNVELASGTAAGQDWWTAFHSPKLDDTVRTALADNRQLQVAQATLKQAQEIYGASRSARLPAVDATA